MGSGNRGLKTKRPSEPDNCLLVSRVAVIVTATLAFITTAPVASLIVPTISDIVIWPNARCPARKQTLKTAHAECRVGYNRPQVAASAPGSLGSMVLYSLFAIIRQWRKCSGGNTKYAYLATHFLARFFASGANLVAGVGYAPLPV